MHRCLAPLIALAVASAAPAQQGPHVFRNRNGTFQLEVPAAWRKLEPNKAPTICEHPQAPARLRLVQPRHFYAVGPVDAWLAGDFTAPWLYVVEQKEEWFVGDAFETDLRTMWEHEGKGSGHRHELRAIRKAKVGVQQIAERVDTPADGRPAIASLDVHAPTGGQQLSLSFCCRPDDFAGHLPAFERALATLTFARLPRPQQSLGDRLWTPILVGGIVGLVLLVLYKHTRGRPGTASTATAPGDLPTGRG
jgi:hypothetical protein